MPNYSAVHVLVNFFRTFFSLFSIFPLSQSHRPLALFVRDPPPPDPPFVHPHPSPHSPPSLATSRSRFFTVFALPTSKHDKTLSFRILQSSTASYLQLHHQLRVRPESRSQDIASTSKNVASTSSKVQNTHNSTVPGPFAFILD